MEIDKETADALKLAVRRIFKSKEGMVLIEFMEEFAGKYAPLYDPLNSTSVILQGGRLEAVAVLFNIDKLTAEQIVEYFKPKG